MGLFDRLEAASDAVQRRVFADRPRDGDAASGWVHHPMARPKGDRNAASAPDTTRSITRGIAAIYTVRATVLNLPENGDPRSDHRPGMSTPADLVDLPAITGLDIKTNDILERAADGARFLVSSTYTDDHGRIKATVARLAPATEGA